MKTLKNKWEVILIEDEFLNLGTGKERPCIVINDYELEEHAYVLPLTTVDKSNDYNAKQIKLSIDSFVSLDRGKYKVDKNIVDYAHSLDDKLQLSNSDINKLKKHF